MLEWTWNEYKSKYPDEAITFKYGGQLKRVIETSRHEVLLRSMHYNKFTKKVKIPQFAYSELRELEYILKIIESLLKFDKCTM